MMTLSSLSAITENAKVSNEITHVCKFSCFSEVMLHALNVLESSRCCQVSRYILDGCYNEHDADSASDSPTIKQIWHVEK